MKILLVDDHADTLVAMSKLIRMAGYTVDTAEDLKTATRLCAEVEYNLLIVDVGLPDGSGLELVKDHKGKSIVLSGYAMPSEIRQGKSAGATEYLVKPLDFESLIGVVHRVLEDMKVPVSVVGAQPVA